MNNKIVALIAVAVVAIGGWMMFRGAGIETGVEGLNPAGGIELEQPGIKDFTVTGRGLSFDPKSIEVKKGDTVRITFVNENGFHDLVIDEFGVATQQLPAGQSETITFVADKVGTFEYYCSVGTHRQQGMWGMLTVSE